MRALYESISEWLTQAEARGVSTVLTVDLACVFGLSKNTMAALAKRGEFGPFGRDAGRFYRVELRGMRAFLERYRCAFLGWVSLKEACRLSGAKPSTLAFWLNAGVIAGGRDMHGRVRIDPASLNAAREWRRWTVLPDELTLHGGSYYSLACLARALTARAGIQATDGVFARQFRRNYTMLYRWLTQTALSRDVQRVGRRRALYVPWRLYNELVDVVRPREAAAVLGVSPYMLHYWARKGRLGYVQFGGTQRMIPRQALQDFLAQRRTVQKTPVGPASPHRQRPGGGERSASTGPAGPLRLAPPPPAPECRDTLGVRVENVGLAD